MPTKFDLLMKFSDIRRIPNARVMTAKLDMTSDPANSLEVDDNGDFLHTNGALRIGLCDTEYIASVLTSIENRYRSDHRQIKDDWMWQQMYGRQSRNIVFIDNQGAIGTRSLPSYPCHYCGIVLPEELVQVDHQAPQNPSDGGGAVAILKVLRTLAPGLTGGPSHGRKAAMVQNNMVQRLHPKQSVAPGSNYGAAFHSSDPSLDPAKGARYSLTPEGTTVLTVAVMYYGTALFPKMCMNNFVNLAPACGNCNNAKKNILFAGR